MQNRWYLGTMGFGFEDWENVFYPSGLPKRNYLRRYGQFFNSVELDTTFYGAPTPSQVHRWVLSTPDEFVFSLKTPRQITHELRLARVSVLWEQFLENLKGFGDSLGAVLLQLPPNFTWAEVDALKSFLQDHPTEIRCAVEFRHKSWYRPETAELLAEAGVCWAATDYLDLPTEIIRTTDFLYIRWIGEHGRYGRKDHERVDLTPRLKMWLSRLEPHLNQVEFIFGYFNNDYAGFSPGTCNRFKQLIGDEVQDFSPPQQGQLF